MDVWVHAGSVDRKEVKHWTLGYFTFKGREEEENLAKQTGEEYPGN